MWVFRRRERPGKHRKSRHEPVVLVRDGAFDVILDGYAPPTSRPDITWRVCALTGYGPALAVNVVDHLPAVVTRRADRYQAEAARRALERKGGDVRLRRVGSGPLETRQPATV
ncbi:MAG: hypothetical protein QM621_09205 [Aeromicrobium sp.]|uniref:hypothetical protein n=1 Tax=Aeromicrobium sp. TaxID=1871063 RepID=UPI0039E27A6B